MASRIVTRSYVLSPSILNHISGRNYYTYVNEPAHPIPNKKPKVLSASEALSVVKSGKFSRSYSYFSQNIKIS